MKLRHVVADSLLIGATVFMTWSTIGTFVRNELAVFPSSALLGASEWEKAVVSEDGGFFVIDFLRRYVPEDALILALRQNDVVLFGKHKIIRDMDERMLPVYRAGTSAKAYEELTRLGIDYIYLPAYDFPTHYNTVLSQITEDPEICRIVARKGLSRLCKLLKADERRPLRREVALGAGERWTLKTNGPDKVIRLEETRDLEIASTAGKLVRLYSGPPNLNFPPPRSSSYFGAVGDSLYTLHGAITGRGWGEVYLYEYGTSAGNGVPASGRLLRAFAATAGRVSTIRAQFRTSAQTTGFRLIFDFRSTDSFKLFPLTVERIVESQPYGRQAVGAPVVPSFGIGSGWILDGYTGPGHWWYAPSDYGDNSLVRGAHPSKAFRVSAPISGKGNAHLVALGYTFGHNRPRLLGILPVNLKNEPESAQWLLVLPNDVWEFRVGWTQEANSAAAIDKGMLLQMAAFLRDKFARPASSGLSGGAYLHRIEVTPTDALGGSQLSDECTKQLARSKVRGSITFCRIQ